VEPRREELEEAWMLGPDDPYQGTAVDVVGLKVYLESLFVRRRAGKRDPGSPARASGRLREPAEIDEYEFPSPDS
jgi:hypothetical protein